MVDGLSMADRSGDTLATRSDDYSGPKSLELESLPPDPWLSVVVPVRNEQAYLESTLSQLLDQDYAPNRVEILVCDGRSTDRTREIVSEFSSRDSRVRLLDNPGRRSASGRNVGFRAARGDIMLVIDGHVHLPSRRLFSDLVQQLRESGAACAGRPQPLRAQAGKPWSKAISLARGSVLGHGRDSLIYAANEGLGPAASNGAAYRREVFERIGYVDENFDACEDLDFNRRIDEAGLACMHSPKFTVEYYARESLGGLFAQMHRYGLGRYQYLRKDWSRLTLSQLVPPSLVAALGLALLLPWSLVLGGGGVLLLSAYVVGVSAASLQVAAGEGWSWFPRVFLVFPTIHFGLGFGFVRAMLGRRPESVGDPVAASL